MQLSRANHYVPQFYLKNWIGQKNSIWYYRLLVSNENVPLWKPGTPKSTGFQDSLYLRLENDKEADDFESWLNTEVETPAEKSLKTVVSGNKPSKDDMNNLVRLLAAQFARTPARFCKQMPFYNRIVPGAIDHALQETITNLKSYAKTGIPPRIDKEVDKIYGEYVPTRVELKKSNKDDTAIIEVDMIIGCGVWLAEIRRVTTSIINTLNKHDWTIIESAPGVDWCTSDDPVICLNYSNSKSYNFNGGIGRNGCEIFFPLSPKYVMATHIGQSGVFDNWQRNPYFSFMLQKFTFEHAFRYIYSVKPWDGIASCRKRIVSTEQYDEEQAFWKKMNNDQIQAERSLFEEKTK